MAGEAIANALTPAAAAAMEYNAMRRSTLSWCVTEWSLLELRDIVVLFCLHGKKLKSLQQQSRSLRGYEQAESGTLGGEVD
jgi:hypothetical protein